MRFSLMVFAAGLVLAVEPAGANDLCGEAPTFSDPEISGAIPQAVFGLRLSSAAGEGFARHAGDVFGRLAKGRPPEEARLLAAALLHAYCVELTRGKDPARLPWHFKDHFVGLSKLVPDFREAQALLERIEAAESRR